jgi:hypothetical protein
VSDDGAMRIGFQQVPEGTVVKNRSTSTSRRPTRKRPRARSRRSERDG